MKRKLLYVTGTRADFGLMLATLRAIDAHPDYDLSIVATGMHLSSRFGDTIDEVEASGLHVARRIDVGLEDSGVGMAKASAEFMRGFVEHIGADPPDILMLLGDRWEMLAAATAGALAGIPIVHLCGGERSGTVDDSFRHAISKLAHIHLVATPDARNRLVRMGEADEHIHVVGTPGLVGLRSSVRRSRYELAQHFGFDANSPVAIMLFHPVVQDADAAGGQCASILRAIAAAGFQALCLKPNADAGNSGITEAIDQFCHDRAGFTAVTHLPRSDYVSLLACADLLIGNSSSGIIEAASFGIPVVNVGDRQRGRERNANVIDTTSDPEAILAAIDRACKLPRKGYINIYGDGRTNERTVQLLSQIPFDRSLLKKSNSY